MFTAASAAARQRQTLSPMYGRRTNENNHITKRSVCTDSGSGYGIRGVLDANDGDGLLFQL